MPIRHMICKHKYILTLKHAHPQMTCPALSDFSITFGLESSASLILSVMLKIVTLTNPKANWSLSIDTHELWIIVKPLRQPVCRTSLSLSSHVYNSYTDIMRPSM